MPAMREGELREALQAGLGGAWEVHALGASSFCDTWQAVRGQQRLFVKSTPASRPELLAAEADGLRALAATHTIRVPEVAAMHRRTDGAACVAMEWLELVPVDRGFGGRLAAALAALHGEPQAAFGWRRDNFIGATPQVNPPAAQWAQFVAEARLRPLQQQLRGQGGQALEAAVDAVIAALPALLADDAPRPSLIHGDLWQGNWGMLADGTPVVFDPAVSCSDAEAELAMMELFGAPPAGFAQAYAQANGRGRSLRRTQVYQLYHLLNHAVLFGGGYAGQALRMARAILACGPAGCGIP